MDRFVIGVDIGTYSAKGVVVDGQGRIVATHAVPYDLSMPRPGWAEHDADAVWWSAFKAIVSALLEHDEVGRDRVAAVATSAIGITMLPLDADGAPLRPSILYGIDTRAWREVNELTAALGGDALEERCGPLSNQTLGPKLLWFRKHEPELFARTTTVMTASSYLPFRLTGALVVDSYSASGFGPYFDRRKGGWSDWADAVIAPHTLLPRIVEPSDIIGTVHADAAAETGLAEGTPVVAGTTDAAAEALSAGVVDRGDTMLMYGTTLFVIRLDTQPVRHPAMWASTYIRPGRYTLAAGLATSAALTRWFRDQFGASELAAEAAGGPEAYSALADLAASSPVGARGLVALPYFSGERTPISDPLARGVIAGLSLSHTRADVYRALLEGVAYALRHNLEVMAEVGTCEPRLVAVGGGTANAVWLQIVSDVLGAPQEVPVTTVGAAYGDAFLAALAAGLVPSWDAIRDWVEVSNVILPNQANAERYDELYAVFRDLYPATRTLQHRLAAVAADT